MVPVGQLHVEDATRTQDAPAFVHRLDQVDSQVLEDRTGYDQVEGIILPRPRHVVEVMRDVDLGPVFVQVVIDRTVEDPVPRTDVQDCSSRCFAHFVSPTFRRGNGSSRVGRFRNGHNFSYPSPAHTFKTKSLSGRRPTKWHRMRSTCSL